MELQTLIAGNHPSNLYFLNASKSVEEIEQIARRFEYAVFHLRGSRIHNREDMFREVRGFLGLSEGTGRTWDGFYDVLTGFPWPPANGYIILYDDFEHFLKNNEDDFYIALRHLQTAVTDTDHNIRRYVLLRGNRPLLPDEYRDLEEICIT